MKENMRSSVTPSRTTIDPLSAVQPSKITPSTTEAKSDTNRTTSIEREKMVKEIIVPAKIRSTPEPVNPALKAQMSTSRAMTVELGTLRDMMPKLKREVAIYSINECQLVKELEKKLPFCNEHKDVRLNLILEEIQRIRLNRRRALEKLKESQVKIAELEFRMELSSYHAGEIFWDGRISKLSDEQFNNLESFTQKIEEKESQENFNFIPAPHISFSSKDPANKAGMENNNKLDVGTSTSTDSDILSRLRVRYGQGSYGSNEDFEAKTTLVEGSGTQNMLMQNETANAAKTLVTDDGDTTASSFYSNNKSTLDIQIPNFTSNSRTSTVEHKISPEKKTEAQNEIDMMQKGNEDFGAELKQIDDLVAKAHQEKRILNRITRKALLISTLPVGAAIGMLLLEWQTRVISTYLGPLLSR